MTAKISKKAIDENRHKLEVLDTATQETLTTIRQKDARFRRMAMVFFIVLVAVGVAGLYYQNHLAAQNKQHIDCIIKLSETPLGPTDRAKYISTLNNTCQIKFVK